MDWVIWSGSGQLSMHQWQLQIRQPAGSALTGHWYWYWPTVQSPPTVIKIKINSIQDEEHGIVCINTWPASALSTSLPSHLSKRIAQTPLKSFL
jgi:hypothetical protein